MMDGDTEPVVCYTRCDRLFQRGLVENGAESLAAIEEKGEPSIAGDEFEKALIQTINSRNKGLLKDLQSSIFDSDSSHYGPIEAALRNV